MLAQAGMTMGELLAVLRWSSVFIEALTDQITQSQNVGAADARQDTAIAAAEVAIEHETALDALFGLGLANSAVALLRIEYEALLRSAWLLYVASDIQVEKALAPLTRGSATSRIPRQCFWIWRERCKPSRGSPGQFCHFESYAIRHGSR